MSDVVDVKTVLEKTTFRKMDVENLLDPQKSSWVKFDQVELS